ncbi:MAG: Flp pilus assembly complex ATPase component TadA [Bdellovibrionales bacterium]|nr:Flp pilus assembly complex ATPase component TadA [Bdellovibrionales bacterium]
MISDDLNSAYTLLNRQLQEWNVDGSRHEEISLKEAVRELPISLDLRTRLAEELWGWGPLSTLIADPEVTEIIVNGPNQITFERAGILHFHEINFLNQTCYQNFIHFLCSLTGNQLTVTNGFAEGRYENLRIHLTSQSLTRTYDVVTIRKAGTRAWTLQSLEDAKFLSGTAHHILLEAIAGQKTILVCGPTSSGKTSLLSALLAAIPRNQRVILLEETSELNTLNPCSVGLEARTSPSGDLAEMSLERLVKEALRMRPDRIVVGEVRGREAKDLLLALSTGHSGGLTTLHAKSAAEALQRLEVLVQMGAPSWSLHTLRRILFSSIDLVVTVGKSPNGFRSVLAMDRIASLEDQGLTLDPLAIE